MYIDEDTGSKYRLHQIRIWILSVFFYVALYPGITGAVGTRLIAQNATWSYLDDGSDQGTVWRDPLFDDSSWSNGAAELGYGDNDEVTVVSFGPDPANKYVTTYFRHVFNVVNSADISALSLRLLRDDGAVVYLNGSEVFRSNMPVGPIAASSLASVPVGGDAESNFNSSCVDPTLLVDGSNVLAVEIHQANVASSDISFNLELSTSAVTRGPYLQSGSPSSVTLRWRSCDPTDSRVSYGLDPGILTAQMDDAVLTGEHELQLTGLEPDTRYYYSIGTTLETFEGGDSDHYFVTSPLTGNAKPTRIWVIGDSGTANANARAVRDAYLSNTGSDPTDLWLMLGDNAYPIGTDEQYQLAVFDTYSMLLRNTVLWPTLGNHDAEPIGSSMSTETGPYFDMFTLPRMGEVGGLASGTEAYYSFDYGNIHIVSLNSTGSDRSVGSAMLTWLENDLASTNQPWIIAYWHHPPYTRGTHNSDNILDSEGRMFDMRGNVLPILETHGVDLVLTGHSHAYERSFLLDGHYGTSDTLDPSMIVDDGDGTLFSGGRYAKPSLGQGANEGAVYSVVGSSGQVGGGSLDHPAMVVSLNSLGSMVVSVDDNRMDVDFIDDAGATLDNFTLFKGPRSDAVPDITANNLDGPVTVPQGSNLDLSISLGAEDYNGDPADWWVFMFRFDTGSSSWVPFYTQGFQVPIFDLATLPLFSTSTLATGFYLFFYAVDTDQNGSYDADQASVDFVIVQIQ